MAFRVLLDANAIFGALQRSLLVRVGQHQTEFNLRVLVTAKILDEMLTAVTAKYPDFTAEQGESLVNAMISAVPDFLVTDYEYAMDAAEISDAGDRHVLAAAIHGSAQVIVTEDRDFDAAATARHGIERQSPDDFLTDLFDLNERATRQVIAEEAVARDLTVDALIDLVEARGLIRFAQHLRR